MFKKYLKKSRNKYLTVRKITYRFILTNNIQTHSSNPISHIDDTKMVRRCKDLLKNRKTFLANYIQEKKSFLPKCPAFFVHPNIFLDCMSLCPEAYIRILGFSEAYTFKKKKKEADLWDSNFVENKE